MEQKGLDIVRRDWCPLSKDVGNFALRAILIGQPREEVVNAIHEHLGDVKEKVGCTGKRATGLLGKQSVYASWELFVPACSPAGKC